MTHPDGFQDDYLAVVERAHRALASTEAPFLWKWADQLDLQGELHYVLQAAGAGS